MNKQIAKFAMAVTLLFFLIGTAAPANASDKPEFPEKGWHKGMYLTGNFGMMRVTNDRHSVTDIAFGGAWAPSFGITIGWDFMDWLGTMLQFQYATATGTAGDPNNANAAVTYGTETYGAGTFPREDAREHAIDVGLYMRATLPYFTHADWQSVCS